MQSLPESNVAPAVEPVGPFGFCGRAEGGPTVSLQRKVSKLNFEPWPCCSGQDVSADQLS